LKARTKPYRRGSCSACWVDAASHEGFEHVAYGALSYAEPTHLDDLAAPAVAVNYPIQWCERYFEQRYDRVDPVVSKAFAVARPFLWERLVVSSKALQESNAGCSTKHVKRD
jgi:hypothetical protein